MERRTLGRTGFEATVLGFGAMEIRGPRIWNGRPVTEDHNGPQPCNGASPTEEIGTPQAAVPIALAA
jgi:hypothetical protein